MSVAVAVCMCFTHTNTNEPHAMKTKRNKMWNGLDETDSLLLLMEFHFCRGECTHTHSVVLSSVASIEYITISKWEMLDWTHSALHSNIIIKWWLPDLSLLMKCTVDPSIKRSIRSERENRLRDWWSIEATLDKTAYATEYVPSQWDPSRSPYSFSFEKNLIW